MKRYLGFALLVAVAGCSDGMKGASYANVTGTVTYNGQPIEKGQITFAVEGRPPSTMDIVDGKFSGSAMVGQNRVSVTAKKKSANAPQMNQDAKNQVKGYMERMQKKGTGEFGSPPVDYDPSMVDYIPQEWGPGGTQTRVVDAGKGNEFKIDITGPK
jgi:hypothetical protein